MLDKAALERCRSESIDHALLEKHQRVAMLPYSGGWSDVGSWNAIAQLYRADSSNNRVSGKGYTIDCGGVFVSAPHTVPSWHSVCGTR